MSHTYPAADQALIAHIIRKPAFRSLLELPLFAWQEILLVLGCYTVLLGGSVLYMQDVLPYLLVLCTSGLSIYAIFTPPHDATHGSVSRSHAVNDLIGSLAAQPMVPGVTVSLYRYLHLEHHRHTGDPDRDPDESLVSSGPVGRLLNAAFVELKWTHWYLNHLEKRSVRERFQDLTSLLLYVLWHVVWLNSPYALEFVLLWMLPQRLGLLIVAYLFAAIQHPVGVLEQARPFQATRMFRGGHLVRILMLSQSQHLMHHLFPMLPYYRYNTAWKLSRDDLADQALIWDTPMGRLRQPAPQSRPATLTVTVERIESITPEVNAYVFAPATGDMLPAYDAGAHIDVHVGAGLIRQYSLTGLAGRNRYSIAVKREDQGRGGSRALHEQLVVGKTLQVSRPRNLFQLQPDDQHAVLVSGGIGITPILSMALALRERAASFELHACGRDRDMLPFAELLHSAEWRKHARLWLGSDGGLQPDTLPAFEPGYSLYLCGPAGFMDHVRALAANRGWPADAIHSEAFQADPANGQNTPFTVELARSGRVIEVPANTTLLDALNQQGIRVAASCVQGLCGTCRCRVLEGSVEHRDQFLSREERAAGLMTACVSRASGSGRLRLDL